MIPTNEITEKLVKNSIETRVPLLAEVKEIPDEAVQIKNRYSRYGIANTTVDYINQKINETLDKTSDNKKETGHILAMNKLIEDFSRFKIVDFTTLYNVCEDYNLYIGGLYMYERVIPEEILPSLEIFEDALVSNYQEYKAISNMFIPNTEFIADSDYYVHGMHEINLANLFYIAAPLPHFNKTKYNTKINKVLTNNSKPEYKWEFKMGTPDLSNIVDPIIFVPFKFLGKLYCFIVDAWDKEGDDERIRLII